MWGWRGGKEGVEDACFIPADGGGGKGLPTILGGRDPSVELCLLRAPVLLEAPGELRVAPYLEVVEVYSVEFLEPAMSLFLLNYHYLNC